MTVIADLIKPVASPLVTGSVRRGAAWTPAMLFAAGGQGGWYDASHTATTLQAGSAPVSTFGQLVARHNSRVGTPGSNYFQQATAANRPLWVDTGNGVPGIGFDNVDDSLTYIAFGLGPCTFVHVFSGDYNVDVNMSVDGGSYSFASDYRHLVIINRSLTAPEIAALDAWVNTKIA